MVTDLPDAVDVLPDAMTPGRGRRVVLVRHGQTAWNAEGRAQGHADVGLDGTGRRQAEVMARVLAAGYEPAQLLSSDLARARETTAFLEKATGLTARADPRLREYDVGERTGMTRAEFADHLGAETPGALDLHAHVPVPGAETSEQVSARIVPAMEEALRRLGAGETVVVVTHGAALRVAVAGLLGWPVAAADGLEAMRNCGWASLVEVGGARLRLSAYNLTAPAMPPD